MFSGAGGEYPGKFRAYFRVGISYDTGTSGKRFSELWLEPISLVKNSLISGLLGSLPKYIVWSHSSLFDNIADMLES